MAKATQTEVQGPEPEERKRPALKPSAQRKPRARPSPPTAPRNRAPAAPRAALSQSVRAEPGPATAALPAVAQPPTALASEAGGFSLFDLLWPTGLLNVSAIAGRELRAYFVSPIGYVIGSVIIVPVSVFAYLSPLIGQLPVNLADAYALVLYLMVFFAPLYTMRLLAEERRAGTLELLLTAPVRDWEVVAGKWLGAFLFYILSTAFVAVYVLLLAHYQHTQTVVSVFGHQFEAPSLEYGSILIGYLGMLLVGAAFIAVGVLASSLTQSQVIAAMVGIGILVVLVYMLGFASTIPGLPLAAFFDYASAYNRAQSFNQGQLILKDVVYFGSLTAGALFGATRVLESRKWR